MLQVVNAVAFPRTRPSDDAQSSPIPQPPRFTPLEPWHTRWPVVFGRRVSRSLHGRGDGRPFTIGELVSDTFPAIARHRQARSHSRVTRRLPCAGRAPATLYHDREPAFAPTSQLFLQDSYISAHNITHMMDTSRGSFYDHDIPSLTASLEAFDPERSSSMQHSAYSARSNMHSSRWSIPQEEPESEAESDGPWAPPAWQKSNNQWLRKSHLSESATRSSRSPFEREITPSRIPLPESPLKHTPRTSPEPMSEQEQSYMPRNIASRMQSPSEEPQAGVGADEMAVSHHDDGAQSEGCRYMRTHARTAFTNQSSRALCDSWRDTFPHCTL